MPITRLPSEPYRRPLTQEAATQLYEIELNAVPSPAWRAAFLRPPRPLMASHSPPELGLVGLNGATVHFRTTPDRLDAWLYRIDGWIAYANSVVAE